MRNNLNLLLSSAMIALTFSASQMTYGSESFSTLEEQKRPSTIQLQKMADDHLEAVLGTGNNVLLKINMSLEPLKGRLNKEKLEVPARLFLTNFASLPTNHPAVNLKVKVDCESITPAYTLPVKPHSFDSYAHFTDWLKQGYFTNQLTIAYDFHIDPHIAAPSLTSHLFPYSLSSGGYHIAGSHVIHNAKMTPDDCVPKVAYVSKRGDMNTTTATMEGIVYLNKKPYPIDDHQQTFPHPKINEIIFKRDEIMKFHAHKWLTQAETMTKITYAEFPNDQIHKWPDAPSAAYSLLKEHLEDVGKNDHVACWNGKSGEEVEIADGRIFSVVYDAINGPAGSQFLDSIVKDKDGNVYTIRYKATTINSLPDDLLKGIFLNLDARDLNSIARVSKRFNVLGGEILRAVPAVARGYEEIYQRFLKGVLIYRPNKGSDEGMIKLPIAKLTNPLESTFDLSRCGDAGKYLSISTGYRKGKRAENANKYEIWFAPRFLIEKELKTTARHFQEIYNNWSESAPVGIFWTWGGSDYLTCYDYLISENFESLSHKNLYDLAHSAYYSQRPPHLPPPAYAPPSPPAAYLNCREKFLCSFCELK